VHDLSSDVVLGLNTLWHHLFHVDDQLSRGDNMRWHQIRGLQASGPLRREKHQEPGLVHIEGLRSEMRMMEVMVVVVVMVLSLRMEWRG